ncbi:MAG: S1 RNA-binding domain-containing protein [Patescibacteria group bacterium]|jgi:small subunit ribosomal protein S1|nr:S1 RNA-binding domain-containing protein [Patescibacteria group bacterium]
MTKQTLNMEDLLASEEESFRTLSEGDTVEGTIVSITKNGIWLDLGKFGGGLVVGPEIRDRSVIADLKAGDSITASVLETEYEDGNALLSLKKASREKIWTRLAKMVETKELVSLRPIDANKGGLLMEIEGVRGFLPVSQLSTENYPRVSDKDEIQIRLSGLIGRPMDVIVLDADEKESKLIFSEKEAKKNEMSEVINKFAIGDKIKGTVTGIVDFGIFINVNGVEGLVHISEIAWDRVEDPTKIVKIGDEVEALIIGIENDRFSLSLKRLTEDPWAETAKQFKVGEIVDGEITRITPFGAFARIHDNIEALVHISELAEGHIKDPNDVVETAKKYKFMILSIDKDNHKIALSLKAVNEKEKNKTSKPEIDNKKAESKVKTEAKKTKEIKKKAIKEEK